MSEPGPVPALPALDAAGLRCPTCRGPVEVGRAACRCASCARDFPVVDGIPDFRLSEDPYLSFPDDATRTGIVLEALPRLPLEPLLDLYWSHSHVTPPPLRRQFIRAALRSKDKAARILALLDRRAPSPPSASVLEIGSGTGGFLVAAARRFSRVVGLDIAMRWLHVSRRRFMDAGVPPPELVCAGAERLPFPAATFDRVVCLSTLEFVPDAAAMLAEIARVLRPDGAALVNVSNRLSLAPSPHVNLWGVGFLPRSLQARYVRLRRDAFFHVHLRSFRELSRLARVRFGNVQIDPADVDEQTLAGLPSGKRRLVGIYRAVAASAPGDAFLRWLGPEWDVILRKPAP